MKRTSHGEERREDELRPTSEAFKDKSEANEIYFDIETDFYIFVGERGLTHIFTAENCIIRVFGQPNATVSNVKCQANGKSFRGKIYLKN